MTKNLDVTKIDAIISDGFLKPSPFFSLLFITEMNSTFYSTKSNDPVLPDLHRAPIETYNDNITIEGVMPSVLCRARACSNLFSTSIEIII